MYGAVNAPYIEGKSAKFYIKNYGTGFSEKAQCKRTLVTYPNGEVHSPRFVFFGRKYPIVEKGSEIYVPERGYMTRREAKRNRPPKEKADREKVIQTVVSSITSLATMLLLVINAVK